MSNSLPWIEEPETGRWFMYVPDEWGETIRRYSDEVPLAASASSQSATRDSVHSPSTPRYTSAAGSSKHSGKRRDSQSSGTRHQRPTEHHQNKQQEQPVSTYSRSTAKYHDPGGFGPPPVRESSRESSYYAQDTRSPRASGAYLGPRGYDESGSSSQPLSTDPLATSMGKLRIDEMADNARYTAVPDLPFKTLGTDGRGVTENPYQPGTATAPTNIPVSQPSASDNPRHIVGTAGTHEALDPKYSVRNYDYRKFFREGRVFITLWTDHYSSITNRNQAFISSVAYGEEVHTKIRRFVVVQQRDNCCYCLPVTSYDGRGPKKHGITLDEHSQIYSHKHPPKKISGISKKALKVIVSKGAPKIKDSSLVNYGRIYTVEFKVKVMDIGTLDDYSRKLLLEYYKAVNFLSDSSPEDGPLDWRPEGDKGDLAGVGTGFETKPQNSDFFDSSRFVMSTPNTNCSTQNSNNGSSGYGPQLSNWYSHESGSSLGGAYRAQLGHDSQIVATQPVTTSSFGYSSATVYDIDRTSTIPSTIDPRYVSSSDPAARSGAPMPYHSSRFSDTGASNARYDDRTFNRTPPSSSEDYHETSSQGFRSATYQGGSTTAWAPQQPSSSDPGYPSGSVLHNSQSPWPSTPQAVSSSRADVAYHGSRRDEEEVIVLPTREEVEASRVQRTRRQSSSRPHAGQDRSRYIVSPRDRGTYREIEHPENGVPTEDSRGHRGERDRTTLTTTARDAEPSTAPGYDSDNRSSAARNISSNTPTGSSEVPAPPKYNTALEGLMSSNSSVVSDISSLWSSAQSGTTLTSISQLLGNPQERFIGLINEDPELQRLFSDSLKDTSFDDFEEYLRLCLQLSKDLRSEAVSSEQVQTTRILRNLSRNVSHACRTQLEENSQHNLLLHSPSEGDLLLKAEAVSQPNEREEGDPQDERETSDEEDLDPIDDLEPTSDPLKNIEKFVLDSVSFRLLKETFHRFIHPDQVASALAKIWPVTLSREKRHAIPYEIEWEVQKFLRAYFGDGQQLGNVLTLTENGQETQASSCRDYLFARWADTGVLLLEGLQELLAKTAGTIWLDTQKLGSGENSLHTFPLLDNPIIVQSESATLSFRQLRKSTHAPGRDSGKRLYPEEQSFRSVIAVKVDAGYKVHAELMSALSWICAAIRYSPRTEVMLGSTSIKAIKTMNQTRIVSFRVNKLESLQSQPACWYSLFPRSVIAKGFPVNSRQQGKGLEISFADMALMSRSLTFVEYDGGLIVEGLKSILIPTKIFQDDGAVQWHYESKRLPGSGERRSISDIFSSLPDIQWYKELQEDLLTSKRCFLGWVDKASIVMGTDDHVKFDIVRSGAAFIPKSRTVGSNSITLGTSGTGFVTFTGTRSWKKESTPSSLTFSNDRDIEEALADDFKVPITVYDDKTKIAWCLPQASVCLHIVHSLLKQRDCEISDQGRAVTLASAARGSNTAGRAMKTLMRSLGFEIRIRSLEEGCPSKPLSRTIAQVWLRLNKFRDGLKKLCGQLQDAGFHPPENLIGVEFADVSEMSCSEVDIKKLKVNQPWVHFVHQSAVLFCGGLGQPITPILPTPPKYLCSAWEMVPVGKHYLVLTADGILFFLNQQENRSRLQAEVVWIQTRMLILTHCHEEAGSVYHTQKLKCVKSSPLDLGIWERIQACKEACFIFSDSGPKQCTSEGRSQESEGSSISFESTTGSTGPSSVSSQDTEVIHDKTRSVAAEEKAEEEEDLREYTSAAALNPQANIDRNADRGSEQPRTLRRRKSFNLSESCANTAQIFYRCDNDDAVQKSQLHKSDDRQPPLALSYKKTNNDQPTIPHRWSRL